MPKKLTIEFVRQQFEKEGYILLSSEYKNNRQKLEYICSEKHSHNISWSGWASGQRCSYCFGNAKKDIYFISNAFKNKGYVLLNKEYINRWQKLKYICPNLHSHYISWREWLQGHRCFYCANENRSIKYSGSGGPNWKGGISCEPYCDAWADEEFKKDIKERDNYKCQNPDCWQTNHNLCLHHTDYNKKNCHPKNLITLCRSCNARANVNRKKHTNFYRTIMLKRGLLNAKL